MVGIKKEILLFLHAGLTGMTLAIAYQVLGLLRLLIPHAAIVVDLEDLLYWIAAGVYVFWQIYQITYGEIRWFLLVAIVIGAQLAHFVKKWLVKRTQKRKFALEKRNETR